MDTIRTVITTTEANALPETVVPMFGKSDSTETHHDVDIFREALAWLEAEGVEEMWSVYYQASW
jgi:hypothetical protein